MNARNDAIDLEAGISARLADFSSALLLDAVPPAVRERAKHLILDCIGLAFATATFPYAKATLAALREFGDGPASLFAHGERLALRDAMLFNGLLVHGLDFDDTHARGIIHASASALPCAFGLAEREGASGAELLTAYICAMEVSTRVAAASEGGFHKIGFHSTGLAGAFGCTLAAARLMGLDAAQATHAQGVALSMASGSLEFLQDGSWTKRLHPGWAAVAGTTAAGLAKHGFVGPQRAYEGRFGLYAMHTPAVDAPLALATVTAGLGRDWEIEQVALKPIPACHLAHAASDAAIALHRAHRLAADEIERVVVRVPAQVVPVICEPVAGKKQPANGYAAQFSAPYIVATGLLKGRFTLDDLDDAALADPAVRALATRVDYEIDAESDFPRHYSGEVVVHARDGRRLSHREAVNRGAPDRPLANAEIVAKFRDNARRAIPRERAEQVVEAVLGIERLSAGALAAVLRGSGWAKQGGG
jgi:2-methylcitrate dehydratase PrpD